jgi:hypothetical protein
MSEYQQQALDFLKACNATMEINFIGVETNMNWNEDTKRNKYRFTITTPKGKMSGDFWDSIMNTQTTLMTVNDFIKKFGWKFPSYYSTSSFQKKLKELKATAVPTPYDILACLQKYEVGTMNDFFDEFGYEVHSADDMFAFMNTYNAVVKEYRDLCRIFTEEQMEMLREIQ